MRRIDERVDDVQEDQPVWKGDHSFSVEAAAYSLSNFLEPEIAKAHPEWNPSQVRDAALEKFEKRLQQDLSYEQRELAHEDSVVRWYVVETSPGVRELATEYGGDRITLRELWEHTREFAEASGNPGAYNREEERVQLAMQDAFLAGTKDAFVSVLSHPESVRYVQIWERQSDGGVLSKQIDLSVGAGRDLTHEEAHAFVDELAAYSSGNVTRVATEEGSCYAHFFIEGGSIGERDVQTIALVYVMREERAHRDQRLRGDQAAHGGLRNITADTAGKDVIGYPFVRGAVSEKIPARNDAMAHGGKIGADHARPAVAGLKAMESADRLQPPQARKRGQQRRVAGEHPVRLLVADAVISRMFLVAVPIISSGAHAYLAWMEQRRAVVPYSEERTIAGAVAGQRRQPESARRRMRGSLAEFIAAVKRMMVKTAETAMNAGAAREPQALPRERVKRRRMIKRVELPRRAKGARARTPDTSVSLETYSVYAGAMIIRLLAFIGTVRELSAFGVPAVQPDGGKVFPLDHSREITRTPRITEALHSLERYAIAAIVWFIVSGPVPHPAGGYKLDRASGAQQDAFQRERRAQHPGDYWVLAAIIWYLSQLREAGFGTYAQGASAGGAGASADDAAAPPLPNAASVLPLSGVIFIRGQDRDGFVLAS